MFEEGKRQILEKCFHMFKGCFFVFHVLLAQSFNINFFHEFSYIYSQARVSQANGEEFGFENRDCAFPILPIMLMRKIHTLCNLISLKFSIQILIACLIDSFVFSIFFQLNKMEISLELELSISIRLAAICGEDNKCGNSKTSQKYMKVRRLLKQRPDF